MRQLGKVLQMGTWRCTGSNTADTESDSLGTPWSSFAVSWKAHRSDDPLCSQVLTCPSLPDREQILERLASHWHSIGFFRVDDLGFICGLCGVLCTPVRGLPWREDCMLQSVALDVGCFFPAEFWGTCLKVDGLVPTHMNGPLFWVPAVTSCQKVTALYPLGCPKSRKRLNFLLLVK